ncbi:hypothetical protein [Polyangium sp. 6x1]|uniref:hypothetical protein n=1 Tax=Polyangium sp. 6x1 TaxID=3042689 RepID=UPI002482CC1F|nr:hypothetical protein [Polyangium sp. 6x1]MDI1451878.1 hypothetical protein [Polyangium sp. 6x1]
MPSLQPRVERSRCARVNGSKSVGLVLPEPRPQMPRALSSGTMRTKLRRAWAGASM